MSTSTQLQLPVGLDDLPYEIIDQIFFGAVDLSQEYFNLARVSRQLNSLFIPRFFAHHKILDPTQVFTARVHCSPLASEKKGRGVDVLAGLELAFDINQVEDFTCVIVSNGYDDLPATLRQYKRLVRVMERLDFVDKVTISLEVKNHFDIGGTELAEGGVEWRNTLERLLNLILEKGCKTMQVEGGSFPPRYLSVGQNRNKLLSRTSNFRRVKGLVPALLDISGVRRKHGRDSTPPLDPILLKQSARHAMQLKHLLLSSKMLLLPPCSYWTYPVLASPTLTSLTLTEVDFAAGVWENVLSWLIYPLRQNLLELVISNCFNVPTSPLIDFIIQLEILTDLRLCNPISDTRRYQLPKNAVPLPKLVSLNSHPDWINLLCPPSLPRPKLRTLGLILVEPDPFDFGACRHILNPIVSNPAFLRKPFNPTVHVILYLNRLRYTALDFRKDLERYTDPANRIGYDVHDHVTGLVMRGRALPNPAEESHLICQFLGWWKNLRTVEFVFWSGEIRDQWKEVWMSGISTLLSNAKIYCPSVQEFTIFEKVYPVY